MTLFFLWISFFPQLAFRATKYFVYECDNLLIIQKPKKKSQKTCPLHLLCW